MQEKLWLQAWEVAGQAVTIPGWRGGGGHTRTDLVFILSPCLFSLEDIHLYISVELPGLHPSS